MASKHSQRERTYNLNESMLTLRDEARDIEAMEFDVSVRFIKLTRTTQPGTA